MSENEADLSTFLDELITYVRIKIMTFRQCVSVLGLEVQPTPPEHACLDHYERARVPYEYYSDVFFNCMYISVNLEN
jgi:hypothetical protein